MVNEGEDGNDKVMLLDGVLETMPVFAKTVVAPLDRVKILFRVFDSMQLEELSSKPQGCLDQLKELQKQKACGVFAEEMEQVWQGLFHMQLFIVCPMFPNVLEGTTVDLVAGSLSGGTAVLFTCPPDLI